MRRFEIKSTAGRPLRFVTTRIFGGDFIIVGDSAAEVNVEGIVDCLRRNVPEFKYDESRIMWVTRGEDSVDGCRMLRELYVPGSAGPCSYDWGANPYVFEHQTEDVQNAVIACEALLVASN